MREKLPSWCNVRAVDRGGSLCPAEAHPAGCHRVSDAVWQRGALAGRVTLVQALPAGAGLGLRHGTADGPGDSGCLPIGIASFTTCSTSCSSLASSVGSSPTPLPAAAGKERARPRCGCSITPGVRRATGRCAPGHCRWISRASSVRFTGPRCWGSCRRAFRQKSSSPQGPRFGGFWRRWPDTTPRGRRSGAVQRRLCARPASETAGLERIRIRAAHRKLHKPVLVDAYLDALGQFVKRLGAKHYVRYVDDFVLVHRDPAVLRSREKENRSFLSSRLRLEVHPAPGISSAAAARDKCDGEEAREGEDSAGPSRRGVGFSKAPPRRRPGGGSMLGSEHRSASRGGAQRGLGNLSRASSACERLEVAATALGAASSLALFASLEEGRVVGRRALPGPALLLREQCERLSRGLAETISFLKVGRNAECRWRSAAFQAGLRWRRRNGRQCAAIPWLAMSEKRRRSLMQGMTLAVAVEMLWSDGGLVARRLTYVVRPYPFLGNVLLTKGRGR
jgi:hypothetical protein